MAGKNIRGAAAIKTPNRKPKNGELLARAIAFKRAGGMLRIAVKLLQEHERLERLKNPGLSSVLARVSPDAAPLNDPLTIMRSMAEHFDELALKTEAARKFGAPGNAPPPKRLGGRPKSIEVSDDEFIDLVYAKLSAGAQSYAAAAREVAIDHAIKSGNMRDTPRLRATPPPSVVPLVKSSANRILRIIRDVRARLNAHPPTDA